MLFDPKAKLSANYSLKDLTTTSQSLSRPNMPTTTEEFENLQLLADTLELLKSRIGPFSIVSAFRTGELQQALKSQGEPVSTGKSYHELGLGIDIYPTTMNITEYFGRILASSTLKNRFVEIAIKPSQNTIHLAVRPVGSTKEVKVMGLDSKSVYKSLSLEDIARYAKPYATSPVVLVGAALALGIMAYSFLASRRTV